MLHVSATKVVPWIFLEDPGMRCLSVETLMRQSAEEV